MRRLSTHLGNRLRQRLFHPERFFLPERLSYLPHEALIETSDAKTTRESTAALGSSKQGGDHPCVLGCIGSLEVRLATTKAELRLAQKLRYRIFYEEMSARPSWRNLLLKRDTDAFDSLCQHLLVFDHDASQTSGGTGPQLVGTYRMLSQETADAHGGFYSNAEFAVDALTARHRNLNFLELGRSCVLKPYRSKRTVELLWHGIWSYVVNRKIDVLFGCASLEGTDPKALMRPLSFLHHHAMVSDTWYVRAQPERRAPVPMLGADEIDTKAALRELPPLIKGYLRLGAMIGDGAVVDDQFGTTDVLIVLPVESISKRYINFYGTDASRRSS
ncbi:MAG: GNAT family N-acyltransferase [Pseudomonadota bacterium]